jgi:hypothetical protein
MSELVTAQRARTQVSYGRKVVVFHSRDGCMYCDRIQKPWEALARRISEVDFIEVKAASSFGGQEIQGYPHFQLFEDGRLQNYIAGAEIERLKSAVAS